MASGANLFKNVSELLFCGRSLVNQVEELIELGCDDDLRAAVTLTTKFGVVGSHGIVLTATGCRETVGRDAVVVLQHLNDTRCTKCREIPVVADVGASDGHIVGVAFYQYLKVLVVTKDFSNLGEGSLCTVVHFVGSRAIEHIVGKRYINYTLEHFDIHLLEFVAREGASEVVGEHKVERIALGLSLHKLLDVFVGSVDFVDELRDVDATLVVLEQTLVERALEGGELTFEFGVFALCIGKAVFETLAVCARCGEVYL